jgi:hypothetical protein
LAVSALKNFHCVEVYKVNFSLPFKAHHTCQALTLVGVWIEGGLWERVLLLIFVFLLIIKFIFLLLM